MDALNQNSAKVTWVESVRHVRERCGRTGSNFEIEPYTLPLIVARVAKSVGKLREHYLVPEMIKVNLLKNNLLTNKSIVSNTPLVSIDLL